MSRKKAKLILNKLDAHIFVIGNTGTGKSVLIQEANIPDSKYFDFVGLTKNEPYSTQLNEGNYEKFESTLLNTPEKTLILDSVEFPVDIESSKLLTLFEKASVHGKRLIVVAFPGSVEPILCRYRQEIERTTGAFIHADKRGNRFIFDIEQKPLSRKRKVTKSETN